VAPKTCQAWKQRLMTMTSESPDYEYFVEAFQRAMSPWLRIHSMEKNVIVDLVCDQYGIHLHGYVVTAWKIMDYIGFVYTYYTNNKIEFVNVDFYMDRV
jgi:hypothetical protein